MLTLSNLGAIITNGYDFVGIDMLLTIISKVRAEACATLTFKEYITLYFIVQQLL